MKRPISKVVPVRSVPALQAWLEAAGAEVGLCHGCFDVLHSGHVHHFTQAAAEVDVLVVSITTARFIDKGEGRPVFDDAQRIAVVGALDAVDHVVLNDAPTAAGLIRALRPSVFFKGADYLDTDDPRIAEERAAVAEVGARYAVTDGTVVDSSTRATALMRHGSRGGR